MESVPHALRFDFGLIPIGGLGLIVNRVQLGQIVSRTGLDRQVHSGAQRNEKKQAGPNGDGRHFGVLPESDRGPYRMAEGDLGRTALCFNVADPRADGHDRSQFKNDIAAHIQRIMDGLV